MSFVSKIDWGDLKDIIKSIKIDVISNTRIWFCTLSILSPLAPIINPTIKETNNKIPTGNKDFHFHPLRQAMIVKII
ncbi:MAG: hypothetical protein ACOC3V_02870 [bacterium]